LTTFRDAALDGTLTQVPGIDLAAVAFLNAAGVMNVYHLFGDYLTLCEAVTDAETGQHRGVDVPALNQKFWLFLQNVGINSSNRRSDIVLAISSKVATFLPGFVDPTSRPNGNLTEQ
jgi:hypothetical protein